MNRRAWILLLLATVFVGSLTDFAEAVPRRRRSYNYNYTSSSMSIASKIDNDTAGYRRLPVYFDYDKANAPEVAWKDRLRVVMEIRDEEILNSSEPLVAEVKITDVSHDQAVHVLYVPVKLEDDPDSEYKLGSFELSNETEPDPILRPSRVYRVFVNLHRKSDVYDTESAWGRVPSPYYVATSGESPLDQARQQIVMRTFKEWYYSERGWRSGERYPMDCHAYYLWATGECTVGATNGWTNLGRLFGGDTPYQSGSNIDDLMEEGPIHGDYVRISGHTFMLLAYDSARGHVWTMEGNVSGTIEVAIRSVGSGWTVGHLEPEHIREELFEVGARHNIDAGDAMAGGRERREEATVVQ